MLPTRHAAGRGAHEEQVHRGDEDAQGMLSEDDRDQKRCGCVRGCGDGVVPGEGGADFVGCTVLSVIGEDERNLKGLSQKALYVLLFSDQIGFVFVY